MEEKTSKEQVSYIEATSSSLFFIFVVMEEDS